jgi:hypothetical protein
LVGIEEEEVVGRAMAERAAGAMGDGAMGEQQGEGENEGEGISGSSQFSLFPGSVGGFSSFPGSMVQSAAARPMPSLFPSTGNVSTDPFFLFGVHIHPCV